MNVLKRNTWQYRLTAYMLSQGISLLGSSIVSLAIIWYVTLGTGSGYMVAGVTITTFLPQALVMLYGGVLADRYSPKKIVILSDSMIALSTFILVILFMTGNDSISWVFFFNSLRSLGTGFQLPASKSILPQIVPEEKLMKANSISTGIWSIIQLISPGLGGLVMSLMAMEYVFMIDVLTAIISILIFATIMIPVHEVQQSSDNTKERLVQGFYYIKSSSPLRNSILLYTVFQFLVIPASQLTPLLASQNIRSEVWVLSVIETAFSVGALAASIFMATKEIRLPHFKLVGLSSVIFGMMMLAILLLATHNLVLFSAFMMIMGIGSPLYYTPLITHIQENTEEAYMGRTFSYVDLFSSLATPVGMVLFGPLASINISIPFIFPGISLIILGIWVYKRM